MFGYTIVKKNHLDELYRDQKRWRTAEIHSWWPNQSFVCRLLRRVIVLQDGEMGNIRDQFDRYLAEYVKNGGKESEDSRKRNIDSLVDSLRRE